MNFEKFDELVEALKSSFRRKESINLLNEFLTLNNYEMENPIDFDINQAFDIVENFCGNLDSYSYKSLNKTNYFDFTLDLQGGSYCSYLNEKEIPFWLVRTALIDWRYF